MADREAIEAILATYNTNEQELIRELFEEDSLLTDSDIGISDEDLDFNS